MQKMTLDLGAKAIGAETCKLGANYHGAEVKVYFFKRIPLGAYLRKSFEKRAKKQKKSGNLAIGLEVTLCCLS
jgi:hypothetical protein